MTVSLQGPQHLSALFDEARFICWACRRRQVSLVIRWWLVRGSEGCQHSMQDGAGARAYPGAAAQSRRTAQARPARQPSQMLKRAKAVSHRDERRVMPVTGRDAGDRRRLEAGATSPRSGGAFGSWSCQACESPGRRHGGSRRRRAAERGGRGVRRHDGRPSEPGDLGRARLVTVDDPASSAPRPCNRRVCAPSRTWGWPAPRAFL